MCTGIRLKAQNGAVVYARTLEFARDLASNIIVIPRNYQFIGTSPASKPEGLQWRSRYAVVGANAFDIVGIIDGVNERGLAGGLFYFPEYAQYQVVSPDQVADSIAPWELITWLLSNFATIDEVRKALPKIRISNAIWPAWGITPPVHAIVHDAAGNSLVIEYVGGNLVMTDNPLGVFTNAPTFDWHITNLRNYINLSVLSVPKVQIGAINLGPLGQGSGLLGLPGDFTSPSRFVRATVFAQGTKEIKSEQEAVSRAFHILNLFDIPLGSVRQKEGGEVEYEFTQWTSASDLHNKRYYYHTYNDRTPRMVDLMRMEITSDKPTTLSLETGS